MRLFKRKSGWDPIPSLNNQIAVRKDCHLYMENTVWFFGELKKPEGSKKYGIVAAGDYKTANRLNKQYLKPLSKRILSPNYTEKTK